MYVAGEEGRVYKRYLDDPSVPVPQRTCLRWETAIATNYILSEDQAECRESGNFLPPVADQGDFSVVFPTSSTQPTESSTSLSLSYKVFCQYVPKQQICK